MSADFQGIADDFFININLQTVLPLPQARETVLHFCEAVQKEFPAMTSFHQRETGEFVLESDRDRGSYRWLEMIGSRLTAGFFNPPSVADARRLHAWLLERSLYYLGVGGLDVECLDVLFGFNLDYQGNRDAIVSRALLGGTSLGALLEEAGEATLECEPNLVVSLSEDCNLQARLSLETRSSSYQVRTGQYEDEPLSVYFTVRQYPGPGQVLDLKAAFARQCELCEDLTCRLVIPHVIQPLAAAIAAEQ